jgi:hypothetical protein
MRQVSLAVPELALIAGTRVALGAGLAILLGERLSREQRRAIGWTLLAVGLISTAPLAAHVIGQLRDTSRARGDEPEDMVEADVI